MTNRDMEEAESHFKEANFRYMVNPSVKLPDPYDLRFNHTEMHEMLGIGYQDGLNAVKKGKE